MQQQAKSFQRYNAFISYCSDDRDFVKRVYEVLKAKEHIPWVDWASIPDKTKWWNEICTAIEAADDFVVVVSHAYMKSLVCQMELAHANAFNKSLVYVLHQPIAEDDFLPALTTFKLSDYDKYLLGGRDLIETAKQNWKKLSDWQWINFTQEDDFEENVDRLVAAINTDQQYKRTGTDILIRALQWKATRETSIFLRGRELDQAEEWRREAAIRIQQKPATPGPTPLHHEYIGASRKAESARQRRNAIIVAALFVFITGLAMFALWQANQANLSAVSALAARATSEVRRVQADNANATAQAEATRAVAAEGTAVAERDHAQAGAIAALAQSRQSRALDLNLLQSVVALRLDPNIQSKSTLLNTLQRSARLRRYLRGHTSTVTGLAISSDNKTLATGSLDNSIRFWEISDLSNPKLVGHQLSNGRPIADILFIQNTVIATCGIDGSLTLWDITTARPISIIYQPSRALTAQATFCSLAYEHNTHTLAIAMAGNTVALWDVSHTDSPKQISDLKSDQLTLATSIAFNPSGTLLSTGTFGGNLFIWDVSEATNAKLVWQGPQIFTNTIRSVVFSHDGNYLASSREDGSVLVLDVSEPASPKPTAQPLQAHKGIAWRLAFSKDDRMLLSAGEDGTVCFS